MARHSLELLDQVREYDTFLESLKVICDMGCGAGEDIIWWATLESRDDDPEPYNFHCFAVDIDKRKLDQIPSLPNIHKINKDFRLTRVVPRSIDLLFSHDSLQFTPNPLETLKYWNEQMTVNGMLMLSVPQHSGVENNKYYSRSYSGCFHHFTPVNLIYMLAVNGFDCRDAYLLKKFNDPWINMAVYKSNVKPMDPMTTSWIDLIDTGLLHPTMINSITKHGHLRQEDIVMPWLNRENYFVDYVSQWEPIPGTPEVAEQKGVVNTSTKSKSQKLKQGVDISKEQRLLNPAKLQKITSEKPAKQAYKKDE